MTVINFKLSPKGEIQVACECDKGIHKWDKICATCTDVVLAKLIRLFDSV